MSAPLLDAAAAIRVRAQEMPAGPYRATRGGELVAPATSATDAESVRYYDGDLVGESIARSRLPHLATWTPELARRVAALLEVIDSCTRLGHAVDCTSIQTAVERVLAVIPTDAEVSA